MKIRIAYLFVVFILVSTNFSQEKNTSAFLSNSNLGLLGGVNFNNSSTLGGSLQIEGKISLSEHIFFKASVGYSGVFEDKDYLIKTYNSVRIGDYEGYQLKTYSIDQIEHSVIPINLGLEYTFTNSSVVPFGLLELGYNIFSSEEQIGKSTSGALFENKNEIPIEYQNRGTQTKDDSSFGLSVGVGLLYKISSSLNINIRYVYRFNDSLINVNQVLMGITF